VVFLEWRGFSHVSQHVSEIENRISLKGHRGRNFPLGAMDEKEGLAKEQTDPNASPRTKKGL
jgi:hypothetical protein